MIKPEQIPDAAAFALDDERKAPDASPWDLIAAALNAWPGMAYRYRPSVSLEPQEVILPLTQESGNE